MVPGKRPRHPMKRTTSMTEFSYDDLTVHHRHHHPLPSDQTPSSDDHHHQNQIDQRVTMAIVYRRTTKTHNILHRRNSADFPSQTFLSSCSLCNRRLSPGHDIYMYRGDGAFCSLECRQQQMTQDEWKEKFSSNSAKQSHSSTTPVVSSTQGETVAAL